MASGIPPTNAASFGAAAFFSVFASLAGALESAFTAVLAPFLGFSSVAPLANLAFIPSA